jgi:hypothetical protein
MRRPVLLAALALAGCGESSTTEVSDSTSTPNPTIAPEQATPAPPGSAANAFIGSLATDPRDGTLILGTGLGLFRLEPGRRKAERVVGELGTPDGSGPVSSNLVVRFAGPGDLLASGHPEGAGSALPENLGLIRSKDGGDTWEPVSELGRADFHILQAAGDRLLAVRVEDEKVELSSDGGQTFEAGTPPGLPVDAAFNPGNPSQVVVATEQGIYASTDGGQSWRQRDVVATEQLAWPAAKILYRADPGGLIKVSADAGRSWTDRGTLGISVNELAVDAKGALLASVPGGEVKRSTDGGTTWKSLVVLE